ncbi:MAG: L,D-transpeptidase family protein [Actinomycetota bacterium]
MLRGRLFALPRWTFIGLAAIVIVGAVVVTSTAPDVDEEPTEILTAAEPIVTPEPTATSEPVATPTPLPTTLVVAAPTAVPTPTAIVVPNPTPEFGPTGRPSSAGEVLVLTAKSFITRPTVYDGPGGNEIPVTYTYLDGSVDPQYDHFTNPTYFGNPLAMMVLQGEKGDSWAEVQIPTRPIMTGWVRTADFEWSSSDFYVRVNVGDNTVTVWEGEELLVDSTAVVTGDTGRTTPLASTYIDEIMPGPSGAYGPWLLSLGVFSDSINTFGGGLPKVALHGTNRPDLLGQYASNGCIRLPNEVISLLAEVVPVGTRVDIVNEV